MLKRRTFLEFLGKGLVATSILPTFLTSCSQKVAETAQQIAKNADNLANATSSFVVQGLAPSAEDKLLLASDLTYDLLISWGESISDKDTFGFNNDYTAFIPLAKDNPNDGLLWVNHEYIDRRFVSGYMGKGERTKAQVDKELYNVGGSIVRIRRNEMGKWEVVANDPHNRRISGQTDIPFNWPDKIKGKQSAMGTLGNCSGGITPWGTILTCEENYDLFYGERNHKTGELIPSKWYAWHEFYDNPPEHYGWVVEVDPRTGKAQKHIALGRCAHECATIHELADGRVVVYSGDDAKNECLYKFVSSEKGSLLKGTLYVANMESGRWESLNYDEQEVLQANFSSQTEVLIRLREAARLVGGSELDRPEDIDIDPLTGHIFVALTNNSSKDNYFGSILKIEEDNNQHDSLTFEASTYLAGGEETGFACPDNMAFDRAGNLWFTSDISGRSMHKKPYTAFKNNGLYLVPRAGKQAGKVLQIASAPSDAELTGPFFSEDGKTLFLSIQHPGETSESLENLTSHWPDGGDSIPKPSVVAISGKLLDEVQGLTV